MDLVKVQAGELPAELAALVNEAHEFIHEGERAYNTRRGYARAWADWEAYAEPRGYSTLPAAAPPLVLYIVDMAKRFKPATVAYKVAAIAAAHADADLDSPTDERIVRRALKAVRRRGADQGKRQMAPILRDHLKRIIPLLEPNLRGTRARLILCLGFWLGSRSDELAQLSVEDVTDAGDYLEIKITRSKTDQAGAGAVKVVYAKPGSATCAAAAYRAWIKAARITSGPLLRPITRGIALNRRLDKQAISRVVKREVAKIGLDPDRYASHSLRAGLVTEAKNDGIDNSWIKTSTGHRSDSVLAEYNRGADKKIQNATRVMGG